MNILCWNKFSVFSRLNFCAHLLRDHPGLRWTHGRKGEGGSGGILLRSNLFTCRWIKRGSMSDFQENRNQSDIACPLGSSTSYCTWETGLEVPFLGFTWVKIRERASKRRSFWSTSWWGFCSITLLKPNLSSTILLQENIRYLWTSSACILFYPQLLISFTPRYLNTFTRPPYPNRPCALNRKKLRWRWRSPLSSNSRFGTWPSSRRQHHWVPPWLSLWPQTIQ